MRRLIADIPLMQMPSMVRFIWHTRNKELEPQVFDQFPKWMAPEDMETDERRDTSRLIAEMLETLTPREEKILRLRHWHDLTLDEVGQIFELTRERIRQIEHRALRKMRSPSRADALRPFADLRERANIRVEKRRKAFLALCAQEEALEKEALEEELLQKYLKYKMNRLNESIRVNT